MNGFRRHFLSVSGATMLVFASAAHAQMAVVDFTAIGNLVQEVQAMQKMLATAGSQLAQAQQALQTMTGGRGMQLLLGGVVRNYLPTDWQQLTGGLQGLAANYPGLASSVSSIVSANAVLSPAALGALSPMDQQRIVAARNLAAMNQALARNALANASNRFAGLQSLIGTIGAATDQKSILELQARIGAEQGMLQNEQTKLQSLFQSLIAQDAAGRQQTQEQIVAAHGQFATRFQPAP